MAKVRISITMDEDLLTQLDAYADDNFSTRSGVISACVRDKLNAQKLIESLSDTSFVMRKAVESGTLDEDARKKVQDFETLLKLFPTPIK